MERFAARSDEKEEEARRKGDDVWLLIVATSAEAVIRLTCDSNPYKARLCLSILFPGRGAVGSTRGDLVAGKGDARHVT